MIRLVKQIFQHLSHRRRWQLMVVLFLMMAGAVAEIFTLGAVVPFIGLLVNPGVVADHSSASAALGWTSQSLGVSQGAAASVLFASVVVIAAALRLLLSWISFRFVYAVGADFGEAIYSVTLRQPYSYHIQRNSSQTISAVEKVSVLVVGVMVPVMQLIIAVLMVSAILLAMVWVNPIVALGAGAVFGSLYVSISFWAKRRLKENSRVSAFNGTNKVQALQEGLGAIRDVIIDGNQEVYVAKFAKADRAQRTAQASNQVLSVAPKYVVESLGMVLIVGLALYLVQQPGGATQALPVLGALALGAQRMLPYMQNIYAGTAAFRGNRLAAEEVLGLLELSDEGSVPERNNALQTAQSASLTDWPLIALNDVHFSYEKGAGDVLHGIRLQVKRGERIGFTGATGSGKSTLIDLILGLLSPTQGQIFIDGVVLNASTMRSWQQRITHVPQAIFLTDSSIAENVALGIRPAEIDMNRLRRVMEAAQMVEFVDRLPKGVATRVGERGVQLSGGQRQRIGLARALYKQADVLILDEATSALDSETESRVMDAIYQLNPDVAVLIIAHRVSTLNECDEICEVSGGRLKLSRSARLGSELS